MKVLRELLRAWTWRMAWRDSRRERRRLLVFSLAVLFGVGALVAIGSLRRNLGDAVETKAKELLGADLMLRSRRPFLEQHDPGRWADAGEAQEADLAARDLLAKLPGERAAEVGLMTMIYFPRGEGSRLVNVRAADPGYPFYGAVETVPAGAWDRYQRGEGVVLEAAIAEQFGVVAGDTARIGPLELPVLGVFARPPPTASGFAVFAPAVFLPRSRLDETGLVGPQSFANFRLFIRDPSLASGGKGLPEADKETLKVAGIRTETVEDRKRGLGKTLDRLYSFFSLIGFVALLLGGVGIASAIHVHVTGRLKTVATLRCLGCTPAGAMAVFLAQGLALGLFGSVAGALLGVALQQTVPRLFQDKLPFEIALDPAPGEVLIGIGIGVLISVSFTLLPLLKVRRVSPLAALREGDGTPGSGWRDPYRWLALGAVVVALSVLAVGLSPAKTRWLGMAFMIALGLILCALAAVAKLITWLARRLVGPRLPYVVRQGLANLYRPRNQTSLFLLSAGLGVCLILTLFLTQRMLVAQLGAKALDGKADTFLIDVRPAQRDGVVETMAGLGLAIVDEAPVVVMRLTGLKGQDLIEVQKDEKTKVPSWVLRRDFRSTYRRQLGENEKLSRGQWVEQWTPGDGGGPVPVSVAEGIAKDLKLDVGDRFAMSIGGESVDLRVANIRAVEWGELGLSFFFVFPDGALGGAPSFNIITTRTATDAETGALTRDVVKRFPNITVVDVSMMVDTVRDIVGQVGWVIQFMALFTVFTGVIILVGTILAGKRDRVQESVLLRTLGASQAQIWRILVTEYALLGLFAALAGAVLAVVASWALATYVFELEFLAYFWPVPVAVAALTAFTVVVGLLLSRGITRHPPLAVLRAEGR